MHPKVALIAGTLGQGGAEKQLFYIATSLVKAGVEIEICSLTRGEYYESTLFKTGVPLRWVGRFRSPGFRLATIVARLLQFRPQVVQSTHSFTNVYAALSARAIGAISIGAVRESLPELFRANGRWSRRLLTSPNALVANSRAAISEIVKSGILPEQRIYYVGNAIDIAPYSNPRRRPAQISGQAVRAMFVGRLVACKRLDRFLRALSIARSEEPFLAGDVVGDGPVRARMECLAGELGLLPDGVRFLGARDDVAQLMQQADMLVLTSESEGTPNVVIEAMAAALPVIATPAGDTPSLIQDGHTGYLVPPDDLRSLAARMVLLARNPRTRVLLGDAARHRAEDRHGVNALPDQLLSIYDDIADRLRNSTKA